MSRTSRSGEARWRAANVPGCRGSAPGGWAGSSASPDPVPGIQELADLPRNRNRHRLFLSPTRRGIVCGGSVGELAFRRRWLPSGRTPLGGEPPQRCLPYPVGVRGGRGLTPSRRAGENLAWAGRRPAGWRAFADWLTEVRAGSGSSRSRHRERAAGVQSQSGQANADGCRTG